MSDLTNLGDYDVVPPKGPLSVTLNLLPEEVELAFATNAESLRVKLLKALIDALIDDGSLAEGVSPEPQHERPIWFFI